MPTPTRRSLLASVGASLALAGCLSDSDSRGASTGKSDNSTTDTTTSTAVPLFPGTKKPDPDHDIEVQNNTDEKKTVRVWVVRKSTEESVFEQTKTLGAGDAEIVYNLKNANPDGVESFRICSELVKSSGTSTQTTNGIETKTADGTPTRKMAKTTNGTAAETTTAKRKPTTDTRHCTAAKTNKCYGDFRVVVEKDRAYSSPISMC